MGNMILNSRIDADWQLTTPEKFSDVRLSPGMNLIMPTSNKSENVPLCLWGLLPNHNHNRNLVEFFNQCPENYFADQHVVAGLFTADAFLPFVDIVRALRRVGINRVTNLPTVSAYGPLVGSTLTDVGLGFERECETLSRFYRHAFHIATVLTESKNLAIFKEEENFALIELACSNIQTMPSLVNSKRVSQHLFMQVNGTFPTSGRPCNVTGLVIHKE